MKRPSFLQGIALAVIAALLGEVLFVTLSPLLGSYIALQLVIAIASFSYTLYLLRTSGERLGRLITMAVWLVIAAASAWLSPHLVVYLLVHVAMLWLVRSLYFHTSLLISLADLGLNVLAVAAAVWATLQSGSLLLALWCFFLVQALFVMLPQKLNGTRDSGVAAADINPFEQARSTAQTALRKLSSVH